MPLFLAPYDEQQFDIRLSDAIEPFLRSAFSPCRLALHLVRLARRLVLSVSSCRLVLYRAALVVSLLSSRGAERHLRVVFSVSFCYIIPARACVVSSYRLACRLVGQGGVVLFVPCRRVFSAVSFHQFVVGVGVSLRGVCGEIELTKTARLPFLSHPTPSGSCSSCRGDEK